MKKNILMFLVTICLFFTSFTKVNALFIEPNIRFNNNGININFMDEGDEIGSVDCSGIFTADALDLISEVLGYFMILGPILLILMGAIDFGGAVIAQDNDALKKATGKMVKRAIATVALFLIPFFIRLVLNFPGVRDELEIPSDPLCGTMSSIVDEEQLITK